MNYPINEAAMWYHGSPLKLSELAEGSTITQWKELAVAFAHKPSRLEYNEINGTIQHNGELNGYLYTIDEPIKVNFDFYQHPHTTMDAGVEWLTTRPLKLKRII